MMYLSRIALDTRRRETMRALSSPGILHGAVERCFEENRKRVLWRTDVLGGTTFLLIVSEEKPQMIHIGQQFGVPEDPGEIKNYDTFLSSMETGCRLRFRLRANPVRSEPRDNGESRGKLYAHVTQEQQRQWLLDRAEKHGFSLEKDGFNVTDTRWFTFQKHAGEKRRVTLRTAAFEGILTVTDAAAFRLALTGGIGRAKAYGCGLLTVMKE